MELPPTCTSLTLTRLVNPYPAPIQFIVVAGVCEWLNSLVGLETACLFLKPNCLIGGHGGEGGSLSFNTIIMGQIRL